MTLPVFPSLRITANALIPEGAFAEAQAAFLKPNPELVSRLDALLVRTERDVAVHPSTRLPGTTEIEVDPK